MRILIDGYNLMHACGFPASRMGPHFFRKLRDRFLNRLATMINPVDAHQTTVVFDAAHAPEGLPREMSHKGITVEFAADDDNADARIEWLIAHHPTPKQLLVVSSDHRVRQAALRRKAEAMTSEQFLNRLDAEHTPGDLPARPAESAEELARLHGLSRDELAEWERAFGDLEEDAETKSLLANGSAMLTDDEIAEIQREVDREDF